MAILEVAALAALAAAQTQDSRLVWDRDSMESWSGATVKGWTRWVLGTGESEWNRIPGETGWGQEVRKSGVRIGLHRGNRGFRADHLYRVRFRANCLAGNGTPHCRAGVHPTGGTDPNGASWGPRTALSVSQRWMDVVHDFTATGWNGTVFLEVDFAGVTDGDVVLDNVSIELVTPVGPEPWLAGGAPPTQPPTIHGMHDPGAEHLFVQKNRQGWVVHALAIGDDPNDQGGMRFGEWIDGLGVVARISYGFGDTLPHPSRFPEFAQRCANFVKNSTGCGLWSIGNEPTLERAGGVAITPEIYRDAYVACRNAIRAVRPDAVVLTAGFVQGNYDFFERTLALLAGQCDGIAIHSYTNANYWHQANFEIYREHLRRVPASMRGLPVYMTEAGNGASGPYPDQNTGFIDLLFRNVHEWNATAGNQQVRCVAFYRWLNSDQWGIETKLGMIDDFLAALNGLYVWNETGGAPPPSPPPPPDPEPPPAPGSGGETFDAIPSWDSSYDAPWGGPASWSIAPGGFLQASRGSAGSSVKTRVYSVPSNSTMEVSAWMKCPAATGYWMELGVRLGRHSAADFDSNAAAWTMVKKFDSSGGQNGNGDTWTRYAVSVSTGGATEITVGFKLGSSPGGGPTVGWDTLVVGSGGAPPPPPPPSGDGLTLAFETMPAWDTSFDAPWGQPATWSIVPGGVSGNYFRASRGGPGSSARVRVFTVPSNATLEISASLKCPAGSGYWMEFGYRPGRHSASDFDSNAAAWTLVKKFDSYGGQNGNGDAWTRYAATVAMGGSTEISVGFKLGSTPGGTSAVGWDSLKIASTDGSVLILSAAEGPGSSGGGGSGGGCGLLGIEVLALLALRPGPRGRPSRPRR